ncbi:MAG: hypothetical protein Phyf2KO_19220 [Phycisphaerales bacterium]
MHKSKTSCVLILVGAGAAAAPTTRADEFATKVIAYNPAPGQFVNDPNFNDPDDALGPPSGTGKLSGNNTSVVTLGGYGGSITLGFDFHIYDHPGNPHGMDCIIYGNAFYVQGNPDNRWAEAALIEISLDTNNNGLADDAWYTIPGSSLSPPITPPLPSAFDGPVLVNTTGTTAEAFYGYADMSPTLLLGDTDSDGIVEDPSMLPEDFYTNPDDPMTTDIDPGSGGGDAFDIAWAINPTTGAPANLGGFDFLRITTAVDNTNGSLGEVSTEIDAVAIVRSLATDCIADVNGDGFLTPADFTAWLIAYQTQNAAADQNGDGLITPADFTAWLHNYTTGCEFVSAGNSGSNGSSNNGSSN